MVESKTKEIEEQFDAEVYKYRQYLMDHEKKSVLHEKDILEKA